MDECKYSLTEDIGDSSSLAKWSSLDLLAEEDLDAVSPTATAEKQGNVRFCMDRDRFGIRDSGLKRQSFRFFSLIKRQSFKTIKEKHVVLLKTSKWSNSA